MSKLSKIKVKNEPDTFVKSPNLGDVRNEKVSFSFEEFNTQSVKNDRITYNGYYQNIESSRNAVGDFFKMANDLSKYKIGQLLSSKQIKDYYHINLITNSEHIDRIEKILMFNYGYPQEKINQFDKEYFELQISDGKRVIWHKVDNVVYPLFIDCNHMICIDSSRNKKIKMSYSIPSSFSNLSEDDLKLKNADILDFLKIIIEEYQDSKNADINDIIEVLKDMVNYK